MMIFPLRKRQFVVQLVLTVVILDGVASRERLGDLVLEDNLDILTLHPQLLRQRMELLL